MESILFELAVLKQLQTCCERILTKTNKKPDRGDVVG